MKISNTGAEYNSDSHTIYVPVLLSGVPDEHLGLQKKDDFHVSLVCMRKIEERLGITLPHEEVVQRFDRYYSGVQIGCTLSSAWLRVKDGEDESIVVCCNIQGLNGFFEQMRSAYDTRIQNQPAHITVFTKRKNKGIWLIDENDISTKCTHVDTLPEVTLQ